MSSIKQLAVRGTVWTIVGYGAGRVLSFGSNLIMTRLLAPDLFGLMSLVYVFIMGLHLFSDFGISPSVIRSKRSDDPDFVNTAWTLQIVRSVGIWFCCILIAFPVSRFYQEPRLLWLLPVVALNPILQGFSSTGMYLLNRDMKIKQIAIFELTSQLIAVTVMVAWAKINPSIWALVAGSLTSSFFQLIQSHRINPGKPNRFTWNRSALEEIASFGQWVFLSTLLTFLASQSDRLILGKLVSFEFLGIYGIAYLLAEMPKQIHDAIIGKVIFPAYTKFVELPRAEFSLKVQKARIPFLIVFSFGLAILVGFGDVFVSLLYDKRYADAAWMLPILALGFWPTILNGSMDQALFAIGNPRYVAYGCFWSAIFLIGGILLGFHWFGERGAVIAVAFSNIPSYGVIMYGLWREKLACLKQDLMATTLFVGLIAVMVGSRILAGFPPAIF
jgi:O-antigen/teichoic acid export membrane protein